MHCSRREWAGDRPDHGHKTERDGMLFAKPLHLTVEEARLSEVKQTERIKINYKQGPTLDKDVTSRYSF
jgi:hypothetical protein